MEAVFERDVGKADKSITRSDWDDLNVLDFHRVRERTFVRVR